MNLYCNLFYTKSIAQLQSDQQVLQRLLQVEACLSQAQAEEGIIPENAARIIADCCNVNFIDIPKLIEAVPLGGNVAIPLVKQLIRIVKNNDFEASKYVHLGATSQDIVDTGVVLGIKAAMAFIFQQMDQLANSLAVKINRHKSDVMIGRTLQQQAKPITFGLKMAYWLQSLIDAKTRLIATHRQVLQVQLAGAVGSGSVFLSTQVRKKLAAKLGLTDSVSWQTNRTQLVGFVADLGVLTGVLGKIAKDVSLLMQTEVGEVLEGAKDGKGGSSTMPHKRNPVTCLAITGNAHRVPHLVASMMSGMMQEHERSAGLWHAEWEVIDQVIGLTSGALEKTNELISNLQVCPERMLQNLEQTKGLIYAENVALALAARIGKGHAHEWVEQACFQALRDKTHLKEVVRASSYHFEELDSLFDPQHSIGHSLEIIEEILKHYEYQL